MFSQFLRTIWPRICFHRMRASSLSCSNSAYCALAPGQWTYCSAYHSSCSGAHTPCRGPAAAAVGRVSAGRPWGHGAPPHPVSQTANSAPHPSVARITAVTSNGAAHTMRHCGSGDARATGHGSPWPRIIVSH